jgi:hypothetical protein
MRRPQLPMPEVEFALLANSAQVSSSDHLISMLGGGWDTITISEEAFPVGVVVTVVFRLLFDLEEAGEQYAGEVAVGSEEGDRLATVTFTTETRAVAAELPPGGRIVGSIVVPVPVQFPGPGDYAVTIAVRETVLKTVRMRMKVAGA